MTPDFSSADAGNLEKTSRQVAIDEVITSRRSVRQFLPGPIPIETVMEVLDVAARAPSGHNTQAWNVHVLVEEALRRLSASILERLDATESAPDQPEFDSYPTEWISPYIDRRRKVGKDMYTLLGIPRGDTAGMRTQLFKNYTFFGAPVGLMFTLPRIMVPGSVLDLGMFMQSVMLAALARGISTCPQAAFAPFHRIIADQLCLSNDQVVICGMSMGYADATAPVNQVVTHREPASSFSFVHG
jgi:nitroreductase